MGQDGITIPTVRGDRIAWLDPGAVDDGIRPVLDLLAATMTALNEVARLGVLECPLAVYDVGSGYARHRDAVRGTASRRVTAVYYLSDWQPGDGGELELWGHGDGPDRTVEPVARGSARRPRPTHRGERLLSTAIHRVAPIVLPFRSPSGRKPCYSPGMGGHTSGLAWLVGSALAASACGPSTTSPAGGTEDGSGTTASDTTGIQTSDMQPPPPDGSGSTNTSGGGPLSGSSGGSDGSGAGFVPEPDGGCACDCDPFVQDCADGEKCSPVSTVGAAIYDSFHCVPIQPDPAAPGDSCTMIGGPATGLDDCESGTFCAFPDPTTLQGVCTALCGGTPSVPTCAHHDRTCTALSQELFICVRSCNPVDQDPCPPGFLCQFGGPELPWCRWDDGARAQHGDPCTPSGCGELGCVPDDVEHACPHPEGCCAPWCDLEMPVCPDGTQCASAFPNATVPPGYENIGLCIVP